MKKQLFRLLALFLTLSILFSCIASAASATDDAQTVYYSDLFYGYSADYLVSHYLRSYAVHTADVMLRMQEDYMNSPDSILSGFHTNLEGITDIRTTITLIGDFLGLSDFTYEQALDAANQDLFVNLFNCTASDGVRIVGEQGRFAETYGYIGDLLQEFNQQFDLSSLPATDAFQKFFSILIEEQVFVGISVSTLTDVLSELVANADKAFSFASNTYEALEAFCVALLMEDLRITMLDDILDNAVPGSTLSAGISRLKSQLSNGFVSYFYYNYVTKNLIDKIIDVLNNAIYSGTPYLLIPAILNLGRSVILDHLLQVPDLDAIMKQLVLCEYSTGLYTCITTKAAVFCQPFDPVHVSAYESLVQCFFAATNAGLEASKPMTLSSNEAILTNTISGYQGVCYESYVSNLISTIQQLDRDQREVKSFLDMDPWELPEGVQFDDASDKLTDNCIYMFEGALRANFHTSNTLTLGTVEPGLLTILGYLHVSYGTVTVPDDRQCRIGDLTINHGGQITNYGTLNCGNLRITPAYNKHSFLSNYGGIHIDGDISLEFNDAYVFGWLYGYLIQNNSHATITVTGNVSAEAGDCFNITAGDFVICGDTQQTIQSLSVHNLDIINPAGVAYLSNINVSGHFDTNGNPIFCGNYHTRLTTGGSLTDRGTSFGNILLDGQFTLGNCTVDNLSVKAGSDLTVTGDRLTASSLSSSGTVTVCKNADLQILGSLNIAGGSFFNHGVVRCNSLTVQRGYPSSNHFYNYNRLCISGDLILELDYSYPRHGYLHQDANTAFLSIGGNLSDSVYTCWDVTAGTVTTPLLAQTIDLISAIDEEISPESAGVILRARTSYNSLHPVLRPYVTNYDKLTAAEELLNTIKEGLNAISADVKATTKGTIPYLEATICSNGGILPALCVVFCEYGSDGQFVSSVLEPVAPLSQGETASVATPISANTKWKVFLVTASGFIPVTASIER